MPAAVFSLETFPVLRGKLAAGARFSNQDMIAIFPLRNHLPIRTVQLHPSLGFQNGHEEHKSIMQSVLPGGTASRYTEKIKPIILEVIW
jgi:hypothetical protein